MQWLAMTNTDNLADVETLLTERDAVVGWLARLDEAAGKVPAAVQERVRLDYQLRLDGVTHRLKAHSDTITAKLAEDRAELEVQVTSEAAAREALAEAELRHLVGEYDTARFEKEQKRHVAEIAQCESARSGAAERVESLEQLLAMIAGSRRVSAEPKAAEAPSKEIPVEVAAADEESLIDLLDVEEEQLLTVFEEHSEATELEIELVEPDDSDPSDDTPVGSGSSGAGALSFRPGSGMPADREREIPSFGMPAEVPARFTPVVDTARHAPTPTPTPAAPKSTPPTRRQTMFEDDIVASGPTPTPVSAPVGRTARCGECGAMNRASEWYCEKCGAELTMG